MNSLVWMLRNVVADLILPPSLFFVLIAVGMWLGRKRRWARWMAWTSLAVFVALSLHVVSYAIDGFFERAWPPIDLAAARRLPAAQTVIVVLCGGKTMGAIEYPEGETLSRYSFRRAIYGARLAEETGLRLAVTGGKPSGGKLSEAVLMKQFIERSLKDPVAFVEDKSYDTRQNAINTTRLLARHNIRNIVLVTDVMHMPRAVHAFQAAGAAWKMKIIPAPMHFVAGAPRNFMDYLPTMKALDLSWYALHEIIGAVWYRLRWAVPLG